MEQKSDIGKRVEETLNSLNGIQRAAPQPWLFSRIKAKMLREEEEEKTIWGIMGSFLSKPVVAIAGLFLILFLNGIFLYNQDAGTSSVSIADELQPSDSESLIASSSSFDFENLVQP